MVTEKNFIDDIVAFATIHDLGNLILVSRTKGIMAVATFDVNCIGHVATFEVVVAFAAPQLLQVCLVLSDDDVVAVFTVHVDQFCIAWCGAIDAYIASVHGVVASSAFEYVLFVSTSRSSTGHDIIAGATMEFIISSTAMDDVIACFTINVIVASISDDFVIAFSTMGCVMATGQFDFVFACVTIDFIVTLSCIYGVIAFVATDVVSTGTGFDDVVTMSAEETFVEVSSE